ncbi:unnamed protein product [Urochloa humidicola]
MKTRKQDYPYQVSCGVASWRVIVYLQPIQLPLTADPSGHQHACQQAGHGDRVAFLRCSDQRCRYLYQFFDNF